MEQVDAVVVGAGASGGIVAKELATAGLRVVLFDRGPRLSASDYGHDELADSQYLWNRNGLRFGPPKSEARTYRSDPGLPAHRVTPRDDGFSTLAWCVGGGTLSYQAMSWRFHPGTFRLKTLYGVPPGSALEDWPITYDDLEPYYEKAEYELGVCGESSPMAPPRKRPYPMPPLPDNREAQVLFPAAHRLGWQPFRPPLAVLSQPYGGRPACIRCPNCLGYGCEVDAKSSTAVTVIPEALRTGLCTLRAETFVREITVDSRGRPNGVVFQNSSGRWEELGAKVIVAAASATETPRLLLNSKSRFFPLGLGNRYDQVGRYLHDDEDTNVFGFFDEIVGDLLGPGPGFALDFQFEHADVPAGGVMYNGFSRLPMLALNTVPRPAGIKSWGRDFKEFHRRYFWKHIRMMIIVHGIPREGNRVDLDPEVRDAFEVPVARITTRTHAWSVPQQEWLAGRAERLLKEAGATFTIRIPIIPEHAGGVGEHQLGSCRMGSDARNSVADRTGRLHDIPNVYVADGSLMTNSGGGNPCLTIQALAYLVSAQIVAAWKGGGWRG
ncbi:MAG: GMC family oxidoreductase [Terriglobia bacterium]